MHHSLRDPFGRQTNLLTISSQSIKCIIIIVHLQCYISFKCTYCYCSVAQACPNLVTPWTEAHQAFLPSQSPRVCSNSSPLSQWSHPTILSSVIPFSSCLQSFPASGSFPMSWLFTSGGQNTGSSPSASVLPMSIRGWFPLGLKGLNSLQSKGFLRVFSNTTVQSTNSAALSLLYNPTLTSVHDYWKNHSFDYMEFCWQSDVSAF